MQFNCGDGGEVYVAGQLQGRYDNDHPLLAILTDKATPGEKVAVAVQVFGSVQGGGKFDEAKLVLLSDDRIQPAAIAVNAGAKLGAVPDGLIGLSQGGGMSDYDDATAAKLKAGGFKWFRMDNVLTNALKKDDDGKFVYDWTDFDKRVDFIYKIGAAPDLRGVVHAASARCRAEQRSPKRAERLCRVGGTLLPGRQAQPGARQARALLGNVERSQRGLGQAGPARHGRRRVPKALPRGARQGRTRSARSCGASRRTPSSIARRPAACCGPTRRPKIGGPALASGPFENSERGHCQHGKGFARGLMLWCQQENLPLDFVSWHEYFQAADVIAAEADAFREYLREFPRLEASVKSFMITEWNEAWWPNRPEDHEIGAAWCADGMIRAMIPKQHRQALPVLRQAGRHIVPRRLEHPHGREPAQADVQHGPHLQLARAATR